MNHGDLEVKVKERREIVRRDAVEIHQKLLEGRLLSIVIRIIDIMAKFNFNICLLID